MKTTFYLFSFPAFQALTLSFKDVFLHMNQADWIVHQQAVSATIGPVKTFFLDTYLPAALPAEVERITEIKERLLEMASYWIGWAFVYGVSCTLGLYLVVLLTSFCVGLLHSKPGKRTSIGTWVEKPEEKIHLQVETQVQLT